MKTFRERLNETQDQEQFLKDLKYLRKEREHIVPALLGRHTGKMILGNPEDIHWNIAQRNGIKIYDVDDEIYHKPIITGFWHKKDKKFISTEVSTLDLLTPLQRMKKFGNEETMREYTDRNPEMYEPWKLSPKRREFFGRIIPALRHTKTGKILIGKRGDWHPLIAMKHDLEQYRYGAPDYQRGFVDLKTNHFHDALRLEIDAASLGDFDKRLQKRNFRQELDHYSPSGKFTEALDYDSMILRSRIVPAIRMHNTGKVFIGKRGETHPDVWNQKVLKLSPGNYYQWGDPSWAKANNVTYYDDPPYDRLYHDPVTKKNYHDKEVNIDSTELMTSRQWLKWQQRNEDVDYKDLVAAIRIPGGKTHIGKNWTEDHPSIARRVGLPEKHPESRFYDQTYAYQRGFYDTKNKKYYRAKEIGIDAWDLPDYHPKLQKSIRHLTSENYPQQSVAADANPEDMEGAELLPPVDKFPPEFRRKKRKIIKFKEAIDPRRLKKFA